MTSLIDERGQADGSHALLRLSAEVNQAFGSASYLFYESFKPLPVGIRNIVIVKSKTK